MLLLALIALLAGAGTALSPCVLPILPALLGAGVTGGRRRPLGIVIGLAASFTFATVALVYLIDALGLPNSTQRIVAIVVLAGFGLSLLLPPLSDRFEALISRFVGPPRLKTGDGFGSGLLLGAGLGLVYAPCAGPILAGVITVSAAQDFTVGRLAIALAYAAGSAFVLYFLILGGRRLTDRLAAIRGRIQPAVGVVMIAAAVVIATDLDIRFQTAIADDLPGFLVNPTGAIEETEAVADDLGSFRFAASPHGGIPEAGAAEARAGEKLPILGRAPEFEQTGTWFNTDGEELSIEGLTATGRVTLIDFWTYTCINCIRTLPELTAWDETYAEDGLTIVGVHTPEFPFERETDNVAESIDQNGIGYPVVQDNDFGTWNAWGNQYWPAKYLIDAEGRVRYVHIGEGGYDETEAAIRSLLAEAGRERLGAQTAVDPETIERGLATPETYLGAARASGYLNGQVGVGEQDFGTIGDRIVRVLPPNGFAYQGTWEVAEDGATAVRNARLDANFKASKVFLVLGSPGKERELPVLLDGEPIPNRYAGEDVEDGVATIGEERLYRLVDLPKASAHVLSVLPEAGISGYAFTFG